MIEMMGTVNTGVIAMIATVITIVTGGGNGTGVETDVMTVMVVIMVATVIMAATAIMVDMVTMSTSMHRTKGIRMA